MLLDLIRGLAAYERLLDRVVVTAERLSEELFCERPVVDAVIAWSDDADLARGVARAPVGFAMFFTSFSTFLGRRGLWLEDLFVVPEARGRGYGKALIAHGARLATERACGRYEWTVLDWNAPAIAFYRGIGADVMPDWRICRLQGEALQRLGAPA